MRYASPSGSMDLGCLMLTLSGPVELLFLLCFIATWTCVVVSVMLVVCSWSVFLSMCLFFCVFCLTVLVNCLLNAFIICVGEVSVFFLKVMVLLLACVGVLLTSPCIVFQRVCVLCLGSQYVSRCSLHMSDLWVCMRDVMPYFNSEIEGSLACCALMLFLCSILCLMCSGSSLHVMLQRGHSGDGNDLALTLCKYDLRKGDLFVLSWARVLQVRQGSISSELLMCGEGVHNIVLLPLEAK